MANSRDEDGNILPQDLVTYSDAIDSLKTNN